MKIHTTAVKSLFTLVSLYASLVASEAADWLNKTIADVSFRNETNYDLWVKVNQGGEIIPKILLESKMDKVRDSIQLTNQDLEAIDAYIIEFYEPSLFNNPSVTIDTKELALVLEQKQQTSVTVIIEPVTRWGVFSGFKTKYEVRPSTYKKPSDFALDESFIFMENKPADVVQLLAGLNLSPNAQPHEILGIQKFEEPDSSISEKDRVLRRIEYEVAARKKRNQMLDKFKDNPVFDTLMEKETKIKNYSEKMRSLIEAAYLQIRNDLDI